MRTCDACPPSHATVERVPVYVDGTVYQYTIRSVSADAHPTREWIMSCAELASSTAEVEPRKMIFQSTTRSSSYSDPAAGVRYTLAESGT